MFNSRLVDRDIEDWIFRRFAELHEILGPAQSLRSTPLVLPKPGVFVADDGPDDARAESIFRQTAAFAGMREWSIRLEALDAPEPRQVADYAFLTPTGDAPAGTWSHSHEGGSVIQYQRSLIERPTELIATFAHELAHELLARTWDKPGLEPEEIELLTDLCAAYLGFGVFLANSAFSFEGHSGFTGSG